MSVSTDDLWNASAFIVHVVSTQLGILHDDDDDDDDNNNNGIKSTSGFNFSWYHVTHTSYNKKDGYRQLNVLRWVAYAPGTIAVNVTWVEREFNACQTPHSMYTSIFNRLHAIARYWSEIATFSYPPWI